MPDTATLKKQHLFLNSTKYLSLFFAIWDVIIAAFATFAAIVFPAMLVLEDFYIPFGNGLIWAIDIVFLIDFIIRILMLYRHHKFFDILTNYKLCIPLLLDLMASTPWVTLFGIEVMHLFRLSKLLRIAVLLKPQNRSHIIYSTFITLSNFGFWIIISNHWLSCGWLALQESSDVTGYLRAFYWSITTLTTVGYGDITPKTDAQTVYTMMVMMLGVGVYGLIIGNIANMLAKIDMVKARYTEKIDGLSSFLRYRKIPAHIQDRIYDYYSYLWENRMGYDESRVLADLPPSLQEELSLVLRRELIEQVPFLQGASDHLIRDLCLKLKPIVFTPGDYVVVAGEVGNEMYFVSHGALDVISQDGRTIYTTLKSGSFFGEIALLHDRPRTASIKASEYCDLYVLEKKSFNRIISYYPDFAEHIKNVAQSRWDETRPPMDLTYFKDDRVITTKDASATILDHSNQNRIPHLQECGGNGHCSTCRIRILDGLSNLSPRTALEKKVAKDRGWDKYTRLACQTRLDGNVTIQRLVENSSQINRFQIESTSNQFGETRKLAFLFCDLRNFTSFVKNNTAPEVVSVLNKFFANLGEPILMNNGFIYQYVGDRITAIFSIDQATSEQHCLGAVRASLGMLSSLNQLNKMLSKDFDTTFSMRLGIHYGEAIIGKLGHPENQIFSVVGDNVGITDKIQLKNKSLGTTLLASEQVLNELPEGLLKIGEKAELELFDEETLQVNEIMVFRELDPILVVQQTYNLYLSKQSTLIEYLYKLILKKYPEFQSENRDDLITFYNQYFENLIYALSRPEHLKLWLKKLGANSLQNPEFFQNIKGFLLEALKHEMKSQFSTPVAQAWEEVIDYMTALIQNKNYPEKILGLN